MHFESKKYEIPSSTGDGNPVQSIKNTMFKISLIVEYIIACIDLSAFQNKLSAYMYGGSMTQEKKLHLYPLSPERYQYSIHPVGPSSGYKFSHYDADISFRVTQIQETK